MAKATLPQITTPDVEQAFPNQTPAAPADAADWGYQRGWKGTAKPNPYLPGSSSAVAYDEGYERGKTDAAERERDAWGGSRCAFCHHLIRRKEAGWAAEDPCGCPPEKVL